MLEMRIITREEWGAREPRSRYSIPVPTQEHWLHHAAGSVLPGDDRISPADLTRIRSIQNYHMDYRGWSDIAYSYLMDPDGNLFEGRGMGIAGGHTLGRNTISHALCVMGNYEVQPVDSDLVPRIVEYSRWMHDQGATPLLFTGGHRDAPLAETTCPGRNLYAILPEINDAIEGWTPMVTRSDKADDGLAGLAANFQELVDAGVFSEHTQPGGVTFNDEFGTFLLRFENYLKSKYRLGSGGLSEDEVKAIISQTDLAPPI